ncbi:MAG: M50 family metallopeptidase [Ruminococcus sp.]|jgi:hypothetical protein|nr:M50 family metallopeptidase [Ruminococcus sp.]
MLELLAYVIGFLIGIIMAVPTHELGHLVCGKISGYKFLSFRLGNLLWTKETDGKIRLVKNKLGIRGILGQCLMIPPADEKNFKFVLYNLGGGIFNIIVSVIFIPLLFAANSANVGMFLFGIGVGQLLLGVMNIIPNGKKSPIPNDGANIKETLKSDDAKHAFYTMFKHNSESMRGKFLADYSEDDFRVSENADVNNFMVALLIMYSAARFEELGEFERSYNELLRLEYADLQAFYKWQVSINLIYHELVYFGGELANKGKARLEENRNNRPLMQRLEMEQPNTLPFKAAKLGFIDGDIEQALACVERSRENLASLKNPGLEHQLEVLCEYLRLALTRTPYTTADEFPDHTT